MSEPAWALLLCGPAVCSLRSQFFSRIVLILSRFSSQQCSTKNVYRVDFARRRRLCIICKKKSDVDFLRRDFGEP